LGDIRVSILRIDGSNADGQKLRRVKGGTMPKNVPWPLGEGLIQERKGIFPVKDTVKGSPANPGEKGLKPGCD